MIAQYREGKSVSKISAQEHCRAEQEALMAAADKLPPGKQRDKLLRQASRLKTALKLEQWVNSPGLRPPS
jgi:hypothetical protein